jgi:hypothetical protein
MYSITNDASFQEMSGLREKLSDITEDENHPVVLVGTLSLNFFLFYFSCVIITFLFLAVIFL